MVAVLWRVGQELRQLSAVAHRLVSHLPYSLNSHTYSANVQPCILGPRRVHGQIDKHSAIASGRWDQQFGTDACRFFLTLSCLHPYARSSGMRSKDGDLERQRSLQQAQRVVSRDAISLVEELGAAAPRRQTSSTQAGRDTKESEGERQ